ncbi:hypothetical protein JST97_36290 [bacterium]|nr:hypothetical protein [bacterium]
MHVTPLTFQFKHFEKHRQLANVVKHGMADDQRRAVLDVVDEGLRFAMQADNRPGDLDPIEGRVLLNTPQGVQSTSYSCDQSGRHLQRTSVQHSGFQDVLSAHLGEGGMDMAQYLVTPGCAGTLMCYHVDYADPSQDFVQIVSSEPARPAGGPFPNYSR